MPAPERSVVDWGVAVRVGRTIAGGGPPTTAEERDEVRRDLAAVSARADELVRSFTGIVPSEPMAPPVVVGRDGWIRANIEGLQPLFGRLAEKVATTLGGTGLSRTLARAALGVQVGVLLGYMSQRVLGQYDIALASDVARGTLYYVGPNIVETERRFDVPPHDFRLWIALHEVTHRTQFTGVPWLRQRVRAMVERTLDTLQLDPERVRQVVERGRELLLQGPAAWREANVMDLFLTVEQRALLGEVQALMSVIEGHGMFVMNRVGTTEIPDVERMRRMLEARRRSARGAERAFQRALGIEMKLEQYSIGERFCYDVAAQAGDDAVNKLWERDGENLPTLDEMRQADRWLARVGV